MPTNTTTYLTRSQGTATSDKIGTFSAWIKSPQEGETNSIFTGYTDNNNKIYSYIGGGGLSIYGATGGSQSLYFVSNRKLRDVNGWYHIVFTWDTTQSTESDRIKIYVNNVQETSFSTASYPSQNADIYWNKGTTSLIGARYVSSITNFYSGSMSHIHFIDGTAYDASAFGSTDSTTGEWSINTSPSVTYGNNGFFILKDGNSVTDQSGNSNNFTVAGGTLTNTEDSPSNVFATLNPLDNIASSTFSEGNNTVTTVNSNSACNTSTLGAISGKYYWEVKMTAGESNQESYIIGLVNASPNVSGYDGSIMALGFGLRGNGNINGIYGQATGWNTFAVNDIINIAVDFDNGKAYFGTNGSWGNSSNPSTGTNGYSFTVGSEFWRMAVNCRETSKDGVFKCNFGNGYFGTTAVSSAGTNASGIGIFEYDVPSGGYTALSTKGLNL
jgi:hypothetical protein